jgi:PAS domain S-box-containing protein
MSKGSHRSKGQTAIKSKTRGIEQNTAEILESMSDAFVAVDREWRCTYVNRAAEQIVRLSREQMLGRSVGEELLV